MQGNSLAGQIEKIHLASVFQNLLDNQATGTLIVELPTGLTYVYFSDGLIDSVRADEDWQYALGRILLRMGLVEEDALARALKAAKRNETVVEVLLRRRKITVKNTVEPLKFLQMETLYDLSSAERGSFQFIEGDHDPDQIPDVFRKHSLGMDPNVVMLEVARRNDEMAVLPATVGSLKEVLVLSEEGWPRLEEFDVTQTYVINLLDGTRDVARTCVDSGLGRYYTCMVLSNLLSQRFITPIRAEDLVRLGDEQYAKHAVRTAVFNYRKALELNRHDAATRCKLAELLTEMGDNEEAACEHKLLAETYLEENDVDQAAAALWKATELAPRDLVVREKLMTLLESASRTDEAAEVGIDLARLEESLGLVEKAVEVYNRVLFLCPGLLKNGQMDEMATLLEEILRIAPEEGAVKKKLDAIQTGRMERRRQHIRTLRRSMIWLTFLMILLAWIFYDGIARKEFTDVVSLTYSDLNENETVRAMIRLDEFRKSYPFTLASADALNYLEQLQEMNGSQ
jgi:tetratricopeptide (TPR) repeat protein